MYERGLAGGPSAVFLLHVFVAISLTLLSAPGHSLPSDWKGRVEVYEDDQADSSLLLLPQETDEEESRRRSSPTMLAHPKLSTGNPSIDQCYNLAILEVAQNVSPERTHFLAGHGWTQLWTRDVSYAAEQAASLLYPDVVKSSLRSSIEFILLDEDGNNDELRLDDGNDGKLVPVWLQDSCQHFGGWPNLSDAIVGTRGSWSLYQVEKDTTFLEWAYNVTKNSLRRAERDVYDGESGLFRGCSR